MHSRLEARRCPRHQRSWHGSNGTSNKQKNSECFPHRGVAKMARNVHGHDRKRRRAVQNHQDEDDWLKVEDRNELKEGCEDAECPHADHAGGETEIVNRGPCTK